MHTSCNVDIFCCICIWYPQTQWETHGGKCGACGDPYGGNGAHESLKGKYVEHSEIVGTYTEGGILDVTVLLTAPHRGWFEFRWAGV